MATNNIDELVRSELNHTDATHVRLLPTLRNADVITGRLPGSFSTHYKLGLDSDGRHVLVFFENDPGLVMTQPKGWNAWLKSDFQKLAKPDAPEDLLAKGRHDFDVPTNDELRSMRTVGCGTNVFFVLSDGVFYASVERTAPKQTDSGAPNPGAYSCAAGGATGSIDLTALREVNEEMFVVASIAGRDTAIHIVPEDYRVDPRQETAILVERRERFPHILDAHGRTDIRLKDHFETRSPCLSVPGLTESVVERTPFGDKILSPRVFGDTPGQMDTNVHAVTYVHLPYISSGNIRGIFDGEENQKGELLKRKWALYPVDAFYDRFVRKEINMSLVPGRVVMAKEAVVTSIHQDLGI